MTLKLCATDRQRAALARRVPPSAAEVFKPKPPPPPPPPAPPPKKPPDPQPLNKFELAGRARRAAHQARTYRAKMVREKLVEAFPACFRPIGWPVRPLKIGIHKDVLAALPGLSLNDLKRMLASYVRDLRYRCALVAGAQRFDLNGCPAGEVTEQETRPPKPSPGQ